MNTAKKADPSRQQGHPIGNYWRAHPDEMDALLAAMATLNTLHEARDLIDIIRTVAPPPGHCCTNKWERIDNEIIRAAIVAQEEGSGPTQLDVIHDIRIKEIRSVLSDFLLRPIETGNAQ